LDQIWELPDDESLLLSGFSSFHQAKPLVFVSLNVYGDMKAVSVIKANRGTVEKIGSDRRNESGR
jgi:hypothetical protein